MPLYRISDELIFPDPALAGPDGLLGAGGDLRPERLLLAYRNGIFPWYGAGDPVLWWSPDPRCVLFPERLRVSTSLRKLVKRGAYTVTFDDRFAEVIGQCAASDDRDEAGTWITDDMRQAYIELHRLGYAHSVEVIMDNELAGGLYGVALGGVFCGESMFHLRPNASKLALFHLVERLKEWEFAVIDCQVTNPHLLSLGAEEMGRPAFLEMLRQQVARAGVRGSWKLPDTGAQGRGGRA